MLEGLGILDQTNNEITLKKFIVSTEIFQFEEKEENVKIEKRIQKYKKFVKDNKNEFDENESSELKETFGKNVLTQSFYLKDHEFL